VTAFPNRSIMARYLGDIAWETEVWVADAPSHLIHFNGERFLGLIIQPNKFYEGECADEESTSFAIDAFRASVHS